MGLFIVGLVLWALMTALFVFLDKMGLDLLIVWLAERDVWWSPYRMLPSGGHIHFYSKGRKPGSTFATLLYGHIPYWHWHKVDRRFYHEKDPLFAQKFPNGPPKPEGNWELKLERLGIGLVGFFRRLYKRKRQWEVVDLVKPTVRGEEPKYKLVAKETKPGEEHIFYFSTTMGLGFDKVPVKDFGTVEGKVSFNVLLIHPEKAEFTAGRWDVQAVAGVRSRIREYGGSRTLVEFQQEKDTAGTSDLVDMILLSNDTQPSETGTIGLVEQHGIMIQGPRFEEFDLVEDEANRELIDSVRRQTIAKNDLETEKTRADQAEVHGQGKARERTAESVGIREMVAAWGSNPVGGTVAMAEAIKEAKPKALGGNILGTVNAEQ